MQREKVINDCWNKIGIWGDSTCPELEKHIHCHNCPVYSRAAVELLDRPVPPDYLREWTALAAKPIAAVAKETQAVLVFRIEEELLALPLNVCQEVTQPLVAHTIPFRRSGFILGLVNVRGELVISVSIQHVLGIAGARKYEEAQDLAQFKRLIIIQLNGARFAFPASEVYGLYHFAPDELKKAPETLEKAEAHYVKGLLNYKDKTVGWLDHELLFYTLGKGLS